MNNLTTDTVLLTLICDLQAKKLELETLNRQLTQQVRELEAVLIPTHAGDLEDVTPATGG